MTLKVHCPECRGQFQVDGEESRTRFDCPFCSAPFRFQDKQTVVLSSSPLTVVQVEKLATPAADAMAVTPPGGEPADPATARDPATPSSKIPESPKSPAPPKSRLAETVEATARSRRPTPGSPPEGAPRTPLHNTSAPSPEDLTPLRPGDVINGYRLEEVIGWGGMSVVFRAQQLSLGRNVALKVMRHELGKDPEFSRRFLNEARALAELSHANIVQVIDQGIHEGNHYLVMEFIDGVSLREVLAERRLTPAEALHFVPELCSALEYAHERGIIHRDIKPENILVTQTGIPKIADFGLVRMMGTGPEEVSRITQTRTILGTVDYMAPEQREGNRDVDHRADIYSLGVVLYEMLTGELPIARFPLPSERVQVDVRLDDVVLKVLQKDRDRRYQSASLVATDLQGLDRAPSRGQRLAGRFRGQEGAPRSMPTTLLGQVLSLAWFPLVVLFFVGAMREEEVAIAATAAAIPWLALQCRSYGWLPPISDWLLDRRWLLYVAGGVLFALVQNRAIDEDPGVFAVALCLSAAFASKRPTWREDAEISTGLFRTTPHAGPPHPHRRAEHAPNFGGSSSVVSPTLTSVTPPPLPEAGENDSAVVSDSNEAPPIVSASLTGKDETMPSSHATAFAGASVEDPLARAKLAEAREERRRSRPSPLVLLAFIFSLLTLVYSAGVSIPLFIAGNDWQETFLDIPFDFRGIDRFVGEVSSSSPEAFRPATRMVRTLMYVPLGIPILLALFAVPGIVQRRRRGFATLVVVFCLISTEIILLSAASTPVQRTIDQYCRTYASAHGDAGALLAEAEENPNAITRLALLHRAAGSSFIEQGDQDAGAPLVRTALDSGRSTVERMIALSILGQNYREQLVDPNGFPSVSDWRLQFARIAEPDSRIRAELREGFVTVLRHVPAAELAPIFAIYIDQQYSPERYYALQWWLEVAPKETFERWIDALETNGCSPALRQLVANSPSRVRGTARGTRLHEVVEH